MTGWRSRIATFGLVSCAWLVAAQPLIAQDDSAGRSRVHAAVLGQVERPGTYELETGDLNELLAAAGGLTPESSRNVRVIRDGRSLVKVFVQSVSFPLRDGDVVLAESSLARGGVSRLARIPGSAIVTGRSRSDREIAPRTTFAALGLRPWPVVLSLPADQSSVQAFLRAVNHTPGGKVTVINSHGVPRVEEVGEQAVAIAADAVVVLPKGLIDPGLLPTLPEPQRVGAPTATIRPAIPAPMRPAPLPSVPAPAPESVVATTSPRIPIPAEQRPIPAEQAPIPAPEPPVDVELAPQIDPAEAEAKVEDAEPAPTDESPQPHERPEVAAAAPWWQRLPTPVVFVGATALFLAILTALSATGRPEATAVPPALDRASASVTLPEEAPAARTPTHATLIDQLIHNELPLVEEPFEYPAGVKLHGQPVEVTRRKDTAHRLPEPHFAAEVPRAEPASAGRRSLRVDRTQEPRRGLLDRALATVNKDETSSK